MAFLGIIEGYYGTPWSWAARRETVSFLATHDYRFFIYAPKADNFLRKRWREDHPAAMRDELSALSAHCRSLGVRFGVGLSPFEIYRAFDDDAKAALGAKLDALDALRLDDLAILFDDMRGDLPGVAETQAEIMDWIGARTKASRLIICPTYYSDDPGLDKFFGARPENYLEDLGARLDPAVEVFWTGPDVCSLEYTPGHLKRVGEALGRKPMLWDNYPVNDGPRMSPQLHLRAFTGRPASLKPYLSGHAVNPALQPVLSRIPCATLGASYREGDGYDYGAAFQRAAAEVLGADLARTVRGHLSLLQDVGLKRMEEETREKLLARYGAAANPGAAEIAAFLRHEYLITPEMMEAEMG